MMMQTINLDAAIIAAWERRQKAYTAYNALPLDNEPVIDDHGPGERKLWAEIDAAEEQIRSATAVTTRGAMIQLSCAVYHSLTQQSDVEALDRGDLEAIEAGGHGPADWSGRLALAALRSLMAMEAAQC
jgi:hypothetical protein